MSAMAKEIRILLNDARVRFEMATFSLKSARRKLGADHDAIKDIEHWLSLSSGAAWAVLERDAAADPFDTLGKASESLRWINMAAGLLHGINARTMT